MSCLGSDYAVPIGCKVERANGDAEAGANLYRRLMSLQQEMGDLADWIAAQSPMPADVLAAAEHAMDELSTRALEVCWAVADVPAHTREDLKRKASALEYLLPEESDPHVVLCRSVCADIREL